MSALSEKLDLDFESQIFPIRTAAKMIGISVHTLRMYEREGLIIPHRSSGNQRQYSLNDIKRIKSLRSNIKKISINGIRAILSMIPCWNIKGCSESDRTNCAVFEGDHAPCWTYKHYNNFCAELSCRDCEVYKMNYNYTKARKTIWKELYRSSK